MPEPDKQSLILESAIEGLKPQGLNSSPAPSQTDFAEYAERFFVTQPIKGGARCHVSISAETLRRIKRTLRYLSDVNGDDCSMGGYVENIILDHFATYGDLINHQIAEHLNKLQDKYQNV